MHRFVCSSMWARKKENARLVDGCLVGMMAWLFERVPKFGIRLLSSFPYCFVLWKRPVKLAEKALNALKSRGIREFGVLPNEMMLLEASGVEVAEVEVLRAENGRLRAEIQRLEGELASRAPAGGEEVKHDMNDCMQDEVGGEPLVDGEGVGRVEACSEYPMGEISTPGPEV